MFSALGLGRSAKTLRTKKNTPMGSKGQQLKRHIEATLGAGNVKEAVRLPPGEDLNEWLAVNTTQFFNAATFLYGMLEDFCQTRTCPTMNAGPKFEYLWADGVKIKKPIKLSAPEYMDKLSEWIESQLDDRNIFPVAPTDPFPPNFNEVVRNIFKRLFRVYGHIYHHHFKHVCNLGAEAHLNTCFKHFMYFTLHFNLVDSKELTPLQELIQELLQP